MSARRADLVLIIKKQKNMSSSEFCRLCGQVKRKENKNRDKCMNLSREVKKLRNIQIDGDNIYSWSCVKETGWYEDQGKNPDHPDYSTVKMSSNSLRSLGDLRRYCRLDFSDSKSRQNRGKITKSKITSDSCQEAKTKGNSGIWRWLLYE